MQEQDVIKQERPLCAYPECKRGRQTRAKNKQGKVKFFQWCRYHRLKGGKADRLKLK